jgi:hypothetical protein
MATGPQDTGQPPLEHSVEVITDHTKVAGESPLVTVRTGQTGGKTVFFRIQQPKGRALLIAVHL